jgi:hypothetical protein
MQQEEHLTPEAIEAMSTAKKTVADMNDEAKTQDFRIDKFKALYQSRTVLSQIGTMQERAICKRQLERMKKLGINAV